MDEVSQVVELEYKGVYYLLKGTKDFIAYALKVVKALGEWNHDKKMKKPGESSWQKLQEVSESGAVILEFPEEMFQKDKNGNVPFETYCKENKLRYCIMPDFNTQDGFVPVGVVSQDVALHQRHINEFVDLRISRAKEKNEGYDEKIARLKELALNARTPEKKSKAEAELEAAMQAKKENEDSLNETVEKKEKGYVLPFEEYLKQGEKSSFKEDPEGTLKRADVCGSVMEYTPYDCMYPIRDKDKVPESKTVYYSQKTKDDNFYTIRREFAEDEHGLVFSTYFVTNAKNAEQVKVFSDKNFTKEEWKNQLSEVLKDSGMIPTAMTAAFHTEDRLKRYMLAAESNFSEASDRKANTGEKVPGSEEAKKLIASAKEEQAVRDSYEGLKKNYITVPNSKIMLSEKGILSVETELGLVEGIKTGSFDSKQVEVEIRNNQEYVLERPDGTREKLSGADVMNALSGETKDSVKQAVHKSTVRK